MKIVEITDDQPEDVDFDLDLESIAVNTKCPKPETKTFKEAMQEAELLAAKAEKEGGMDNVPQVNKAPEKKEKPKATPMLQKGFLQTKLPAGKGKAKLTVADASKPTATEASKPTATKESKPTVNGQQKLKVPVDENTVQEKAQPSATVKSKTTDKPQPPKTLNPATEKKNNKKTTTEATKKAETVKNSDSATSEPATPTKLTYAQLAAGGKEKKLDADTPTSPTVEPHTRTTTVEPALVVEQIAAATEQKPTESAPVATSKVEAASVANAEADPAPAGKKKKGKKEKKKSESMSAPGDSPATASKKAEVASAVPAQITPKAPILMKGFLNKGTPEVQSPTKPVASPSSVTAPAPLPHVENVLVELDQQRVALESHPALNHLKAKATTLKEAGNAFFKRREWRDAVLRYTAALELRPHEKDINAQLYLNRAVCYSKLNEPELSALDAAAATRFDRTYLKAYFRCTEALAQLGEQRAALACALSGLTHEPSNAQLLQLLYSAAKQVLALPRAETYHIRVGDTIGRGKGLFATRIIRQGEEILREKPLFVFHDIEQDEDDGDVSATAGQVHLRLNSGAGVSGINTIPPATVKEITDAAAKLTSKQRDAFVALHDTFSPLSPTPLGITMSNAIKLGADKLGMFALACRLNHSCSPNAVWTYVPSLGVKVVHAERDIAAGEEITVSYISHDIFASRQERHDQLRGYNFVCECDTCRVNDEEKEKHRGDIGRAYTTLDLMKRHDPSRTVKVIEAIMKVQDADGICDFGLKAEMYGTAVVCCLENPSIGDSAVWTKLTFACLLTCRGRDHPETLKWADLAAKADVIVPQRVNHHHEELRKTDEATTSA